MRWARHVACKGKRGGVYRERDYLEESGVDGRNILRSIFRKWKWGHGLD
jgi:hypothetical protein